MRNCFRSNFVVSISSMSYREFIIGVMLNMHLYMLPICRWTGAVCYIDYARVNVIEIQFSAVLARNGGNVKQ